MAIFAIKVLLKAFAKQVIKTGLSGNDSSQSFWPEARRTGGIFLYDESDELMDTEIARRNLFFFLEKMRRQGVELFVDGEAAMPGEIASRAVCEDSFYMADYVLGEEGKLNQIRFDRVTRQ